MVWLAVLCLVLAALATPASAAQQKLEMLSYKFYALRDVVFVDFYNPTFSPIDTVNIDMVIREGTGRNRLVALGQAKLPANLVLSPGEHTSIKVPIKTRVVRDIPSLAQFEFRITGRQLDKDKAPPDVVVQDSVNGASMEFNRDVDGVPVVLGFIELNPSITADTTVQVDAGVLTFYDNDHEVVWSEILPIGGKLANHDSLMVWARYEQISSTLVPDVASIDVKFVVKPSR